MINIGDRFEIPIFIRYEYDNMKGNARCIKWGLFWRLWVIQSHRQYHHLIDRI